MSPDSTCRLAALAMILLSAPHLPACAADGRSYPVEVGPVAWQRDHRGALKDSARTGKPVFAFFQEVPGCSGCKTFGREVMAEPSIVAAIEAEFTPLLIFNNRKGKDASLLERYDEPAWNYQVVRFLDSTGNDLIPRKDRVWTVDSLSARMVLALRAASRDVPGSLEVLAQESGKSHHARAAFSQHCFWTGERQLGQIPGVITTEAGFLDGKEVTLLTYDESQLSLDELVKRATQTESADGVYLPTGDPEKLARRNGLPLGTLDRSYRRAPHSDQKRQIRNSPLAELGLSPMQATKVNAFAPSSMEKALGYLTPEQRARFEELSRQQ